MLSTLQSFTSFYTSVIALLSINIKIKLMEQNEQPFSESNTQDVTIKRKKTFHGDFNLSHLTFNKIMKWNNKSINKECCKKNLSSQRGRNLFEEKKFFLFTNAVLNLFTCAILAANVVSLIEIEKHVLQSKPAL